MPHKYGYMACGCIACDLAACKALIPEETGVAVGLETSTISTEASKKAALLNCWSQKG